MNATNSKIECSDLNDNIISLWPQDLLCMRCMNGGGKLPFMEEHGLLEKYEKIISNPDIHIRLTGAFDEIGARTPTFYEQTPKERKRDLDVLQKLGLTMGDTRIARDLFALIDKRIEDIEQICSYDTEYTEVWQECELARTSFYKEGSKVKLKKRSENDMKVSKQASCLEIENSDKIVIRPHHLLCVICYIGGDNNSIPLAEDNLYEIWVKMRNNPDIPVTFVEGPGECMVCPPCHSYVPERGICDAACHLRDRKKDLDAMMILGILPGDTLTAKEVIDRIINKIPKVASICSYDLDTSPEWTGCHSSKSGRYEKGIEKGIL